MTDVKRFITLGPVEETGVADGVRVVLGREEHGVIVGEPERVGSWVDAFMDSLHLQHLLAKPSATAIHDIHYSTCLCHLGRCNTDRLISILNFRVTQGVSFKIALFYKRYTERFHLVSVANVNAALKGSHFRQGIWLAPSPPPPLEVRIKLNYRLSCTLACLSNKERIFDFDQSNSKTKSNAPLRVHVRVSESLVKKGWSESKSWSPNIWSKKLPLYD